MGLLRKASKDLASASVGCSLVGLLVFLLGNLSTPGGLAPASAADTRDAFLSHSLQRTEPPDVDVKPAETRRETDLFQRDRSSPELQQLRVRLQDDFDRFAWESFIALNWPAASRKRGEPDMTRSFGDMAGPRVWETWKASWELIQPKGESPSGWNDYTAITPCGQGSGEMGGGAQRLMISLSKLDPVFDSFVNQAAEPEDHCGESYPLIDQAGNYVRYEVRMNHVQYDFLWDNKYYLRSKLPKSPGPDSEVKYARRIDFLDGSIEVKAAWRQLPDDDPELLRRYYVVRARLVDPGTMRCGAEKCMGLVGFHIVRKTRSRPQWVWATFEHIDNVPENPTRPEKGRHYSFFNPRRPFNPVLGTPDYKPHMILQGKKLVDQAPVQVTRLTGIAESTKRTNELFWSHPDIRNTCWRYYQLVGTEWPSPPGTSNTRDPEDEVDFVSSNPPLANVTMETYKQTRSCMKCHMQAQRSKFVMFLERRAYTDNIKEALADQGRCAAIVEGRRATGAPRR